MRRRRTGWRLDGQAGNERERVLDFVDLPTLGRLSVHVGNGRDQFQIGLLGGHLLGLSSEQHEVTNAEHLEVLHTE